MTSSINGQPSHDYNPSPGLEKIEATVLAINADDDKRNPPETGVSDAPLKRIRNAKLYLIPASTRDPRSSHHRQREILRHPVAGIAADGAATHDVRRAEPGMAQRHAEIAGRSPIAKTCGGVRVIPPGIDTTVFRPQDKSLCRKYLDLPAGAFVIVTGGASLTDAKKMRASPFLLGSGEILSSAEKIAASVPSLPARISFKLFGARENRSMP